MRARTLGLVALKLAVSAGALIYVGRQIDFGALWTHIPNPWSWQILAAEACFLVAIGISVHRWHAILRRQGQDVPLRPLWIIVWISNFFSMLLPGGLGRDLSRGVYLSRFRIGTLDVARSILTDRFIGLVSVILLSIPAMIFALRTGGGLAPLGWILLLLVLGLPAGLWFCWLADRWHRGRTATESRFARTVHAAAAILADFRDPRLFGIPFLQSCLMMAATILCVMSLASAIGGVAAPAWGQALFLPVIFLLSNLPISIAGIGVREAAFVSLFGAVGASAEQALAVSLSFFALGVLNNLIGGLLYLIYRPSRTPPVAEA